MTDRRRFFGIAAGAFSGFLVKPVCMPAPANGNEYIELLTEAVRQADGFHERFLKSTIAIMNATAKGGTL